MSALYPGMERKHLERWALSKGVTHALSLPAKVLKVGGYPSWLWAHKQHNTPIVDIVTRRSAPTADEATSLNAPLEFQQAAICYLEQSVMEVRRALKDERNLLERTPPKEPELRRLWNRLIQHRSELRSTISPRSRVARITPRTWLDEENLILNYQEETPAWCGDGRRLEIRIHLQQGGSCISCKCPGRKTTCRLAISAIDQCLEIITDPDEPRLSRLIMDILRTPIWMRSLQSIDKVLFARDGRPKSGESLGWRVLETRKLLQLDPVWCIKVDGDWSFRRVDLPYVRENPLKTSRRDQAVADLLLESRSPEVSAGKPHRQALVHQAILHLCDHPMVFFGNSSKAIRVQEKEIRLHLSPVQAGVEMQLLCGGSAISPSDLHDKILQRGGGGLVVYVESGACTILRITNKIQDLISVMSQTRTVFPTEAIPDIFERIESLQHILPTHLDTQLKGTLEKTSQTPVLRLRCNSDGLLIAEALVQPLREGFMYPPGSGNTEVYVRKNGQSHYGKRDLVGEARLLGELLQLLSLPPQSENTWYIREEDEVFLFLSVLRRNQDLCVVQWLTTPQHISAPLGKQDLSIDITNKFQWFILDGTLFHQGEGIPLRHAIWAATEARPYLLVQGNTWLVITEELRQILALIADTVRENEEQLLVHRYHAEYLSEEFKSGISGDHSSFQTMLNSVQEPRWSPEGFALRLRPYQIEGVEWLLRQAQWAPGACLADEMGLGKTVQSLAFLHQQQGDKPTLIVAPTSVLHNWAREIALCTPNFRSIMYVGTNREILIKNSGPSAIILVSYTILTRDIEILQSIPFSTFIIDEAQAIKNPQAERSRAACKIDAEFHLALSGTPIENSLADIWSIFHCCIPELLGSWHNFKKQYALPIQAGSEMKLSNLKRVLSPFFLRRNKNGVSEDLPDKIEINEFISLSIFERMRYEEIRKSALNKLNTSDPQSRFQLLAEITKLRQLSCHSRLVDPMASQYSSKIERAVEIMRNLHSQGKKTLVFSQFVRLLKLLRMRMDEEDWKYCFLDGGTPLQEREKQIRIFQSTDIPFFLLSLKAGGVGLNLTAATEVIHLDPWWNPATEDQASDRAHRIGQHQPVTIIRLIANDTIESNILQLHQLKRAMAASILSDSNITLDIEDIRTLLEHQ